MQWPFRSNSDRTSSKKENPLLSFLGNENIFMSSKGEAIWIGLLTLSSHLSPHPPSSPNHNHHPHHHPSPHFPNPCQLLSSDMTWKVPYRKIFQKNRPLGWLFVVVAMSVYVCVTAVQLVFSPFSQFVSQLELYNQLQLSLWSDPIAFSIPRSTCWVLVKIEGEKNLAETEMKKLWKFEF